MVICLHIIETTIVLSIKNKCGNLADSNNYRPVAIATIVLKFFLSLLFYISAKSSYTHEIIKFGFKPKHSTELCIYTIKEFVYHYKPGALYSIQYTVFVTLLDASKSYD